MAYNLGTLQGVAQSMTPGQIFMRRAKSLLIQSCSGMWHSHFIRADLKKIAPIWSSVDTLLDKSRTIEYKLSVLVQTISNFCLFLSVVYFGCTREGWLS